jgi:hypothetical protein
MPGTVVAVTGQSPSPDAPQGLSVLEAVLERITYANEDTGYTIVRVALARGQLRLQNVPLPSTGKLTSGPAGRLHTRLCRVLSSGACRLMCDSAAPGTRTGCRAT